MQHKIDFNLPKQRHRFMSKRPDLPVLFLKDQRLKAVLLRIWML